MASEVTVRWMTGDEASWRRANVEETEIYVKITDLDAHVRPETRIPWVNIRDLEIGEAR
ncbi:hypothetical protein [Streptomyces atratus]|uniref:hypothetical protein n=1 Tax=Streptomyces atratus TaxID=1893 RepID=UPI003662916E